MAIVFEAPIDENDVRLVGDSQSVELPREKFHALVEYCEQLEGALKYTDFVYEQEKALVACVTRTLLDSFRLMNELGQSSGLNYLYAQLTSEINKLYLNGVISKEGAQTVLEEMSKLFPRTAAASSWGHAEAEADAESGAGHGR